MSNTSTVLHLLQQLQYFKINLISSVISFTATDLTSQWETVLQTYSPSALTDLVSDLDEYISNLADNMATKFVTGGMSPFQVVTANVGE